MNGERHQNGTSTTSATPVAGRLAEWERQLITKDDPLHVHKTLGVLALCSFIFRLVQFGETDMAFQSHPEWTIPTMVLHLLLNLSAFEFKIPQKRIASGYRIWPEYRLHNLVFLSRSLAIIGLNLYEMHYSLEPNYTANLVIVLATMALADLSSHVCGPQYTSGTIRELEAPKFARYFFSTAQFFVTSLYLYGLRRNSAYFMILIVVQGTAFAMTLRRKNLLSHSAGVAIYGSALVIGFFIIEGYETPLTGGPEAHRIKGTVAGLVLLLRLAPSLLPRHLQNKYLLWTCAGVFMNQGLRPIAQGRPQDAWLTVDQLKVLHFVTILGIVALGYYKCNYGYERNDDAKADVKAKATTSSKNNKKEE